MKIYTSNHQSTGVLRARRAALLVALLSLVVLLFNPGQAKESPNTGPSNSQPLAGLDKMLKQANGAKIDAIVDPKLTSNVTNALNDMAMNLRKMLVENRRLSMQVQDLVSRVQNITGVNATNSLNNMQQQSTMSNLTGLANNFNLQQLSTLMPRFN